MCNKNQSSAATLRQGEPQMAAGIQTITKETVHKSIFALEGQAVPVSAFAVFIGIFAKNVPPADCTRSL
ncbi:hypothetical protein [Granulicella sp. dw_53]|uniref:hypothetical protein n=1 Tax=Granulicella sp. dw_53 TaxID=2719792 RepID=UPI001BD501BC|nr:hypothetical protein [Granulicella sp. dw_53]